LYIFKSIYSAESSHLLQPEIWDVFDLLEVLCIDNGTHAKITSTWRPKTTDSGVHEAGRAIDAVPLKALPFDICIKIRDEINQRVKYGDGSKPTCLYHDAGSGYHWHLQTKGA